MAQLLDAGVTENVRLTLWAAANRMIADAPLLGLGLGTFQDAYPLYASQVLPYVMDKAHCDYLEFAAGLGLPAAIAWWSAMASLVVLCLRGVRVRHRHRLYPILALGRRRSSASIPVLISVFRCPPSLCSMRRSWGSGPHRPCPRTIDRNMEFNPLWKFRSS